MRLVHRFLLAATAALVSNTPALAGEPVGETLYLAPRQSLPLLAQPQPGATMGRSLTTDEPLLVITRQGDFSQVRTSDGVLGWVRNSNLTATAPRTQDAIVAENAELMAQARNLDAQVRAFQDENTALRARLDAVEQELAIATRPVPLTLPGILDFLRRLVTDLRFWMGTVLFGLACLASFLAGVRWRNQRIRERLGGLDL